MPCPCCLCRARHPSEASTSEPWWCNAPGCSCWRGRRSDPASRRPAAARPPVSRTTMNRRKQYADAIARFASRTPPPPSGTANASTYTPAPTRQTSPYRPATSPAPGSRENGMPRNQPTNRADHQPGIGPWDGCLSVGGWADSPPWGRELVHQPGESGAESGRWSRRDRYEDHDLFVHPYLPAAGLPPCSAQSPCFSSRSPLTRPFPARRMRRRVVEVLGQQLLRSAR